MGCSFHETSRPKSIDKFVYSSLFESTNDIQLSHGMHGLMKAKYDIYILKHYNY